MWYFIVGIFGLMVGSFLNVIIYRWPRDESFVGGRSKCPGCGKELRPWDMFPVVSWLVLGGRCRDCGEGISLLYPTVELMNAVLWILVVYLGDWGGILWSGGVVDWVMLVLNLLVMSVLVVIFWIDYQTYLIPDGTSMTLAVAGLIAGLLQGNLVDRLLWGLGGGLFFLFLHLVTKGKGMGLGDVKLVPAMGLVLGQLLAVALGAAFFIGAVVGVGMLAVGRAKFGKAIPFGPFLVLGMWLSMIGGDEVISWYLDVLGL